MTDVHVGSTMSCIKPNNRLPFVSNHGQVLHGESNNLSLFQIKADPDLIFIAQNYLESFALSLSSLSSAHSPEALVAAIIQVV
jgi:hypothetical protein